MNFDLAGFGHSFKGTMAYYLHDKRQDEASPHLSTAERVAWTETRNLATDGPHTATQIMIATAQSADALKAAAGIKNTGRKATRGPVYAFALSWHPSEAEGLDRAEMVRVADHALKTLGLDHLQSVIVAHTDREHPHVHVIVNRVNPENGKAEPIDGMKVKKLDAWADQYERARGQIVSPNRAKKYDEIRRKQEQHPDADKRRAFIEAKKAAQLAQPKPKPPTRGQMLKDLADAQRAQQRQDWKDWGAAAKAERGRIYDRYGAAIKAATAQHKADTKGDWSQHFRQERDRARAFAEREKGLGGVIRNALEAAKKQFREQPQGGRGMLALTFANVLSSDARRQAFEAAQGMTKLQFMAQLRAQQDARIEAIKKERASALIEQGRRVDASKAALIERQNHDRDKMREAWRQFYASKESIAAGPSYRTRRPWPLPLREALVKDQFEKARLAEANIPPPVAPHDERRLSTPAPEQPSRRASTDWAALHNPPAQEAEPSRQTNWAALHQPLTAEQVRAATQPKQDGPDQTPPRMRR